MAQNRWWLFFAGAVGLGAGWLLGRRDRIPSPPPPVVDPGLAIADEPPAPERPPPPEGEPAVVDAPASEAELIPVDCALYFGPTPPSSLRISWRSIVLGDPAIDPGELQERIRDRARTVPVGPRGLRLELPRQADVLLVMDGNRVRRAYPLAWDASGGTCTGADELFPTVRVSGRVRGLEPGDQVEVFLCGEWLEVDARGRFSGTAPAIDPCLAFASRQDGLLGAMGGLVDLDLSDGGVLGDLELDLPEYEMAGIGAALTVVEGGAEVLQAIPGSPAEDLGLQAGDTIVMVDGEEIDGWELADVVAAITGPEGTEVELLVEDEGGQEHRVVVERRPIRQTGD